ncbi:hypothetical protein QFZ65_001291 [Arthrobacter sp. B3I9]|uniref:hypothetical protein n=1 Tax=Arthrobacter sp. B3I9 TaxID=3042270 RepID=UPI00278FB304|nr:hypothetical protein [Arthrobacter sp. B3I9]MDQ0849353.1 hypothetical protein [Arthrobacter sp. B3I9]
MDFPLSSSVILVIAVALWIVWVAPYVLRNGRHQLQPAGEHLADVVDNAAADPQAGKVMMMTPQQERPVSTSHSRVPALSSTPPASDPRHEEAGQVFRIRYGRLGLALAGLLCLITGVVSAALRLFGIGSGWLPVGTLLAAIGSVALLRRLAVRDRRRKVNDAFRAAMSAPSSAPAEFAQQSAPRETELRRESPLFDAQAVAPTTAPDPMPKPLAAWELREAALAEAVASGDLAARLDQGTEPSEGAPWEPVEVPKPTYVEAAKAERAAPGPLDLPDAPKAVGKPSLKQGANQAAAAVSADADDDAKAVGKGQRALSNLDDVLQRRRA